MGLDSNIFISDISVDNLKIKLRLYMVDNIKTGVIEDEFKKHNDMASKLSSELHGFYIFSIEKNGFIGYSDNTCDTIKIDDLTYKFIKNIYFNELNKNDVLNYLRKVLYKRLQKDFISSNSHKFYSKKPNKNNEFIEFKGFDIVYNILSTNKISMSLDINNKFFNSKSLMEEIKDKSTFNEIKNIISKSGAITLYDELRNKIIRFNGISEKKPENIYIDNKNLIDYVKSKYPSIKELYNDQYVFLSNDYGYLSQFLHGTYNSSKIRNKKLLKPVIRYNEINNIIRNYNLDKIDINGNAIYFKKIILNQDNTFVLKKPELLFSNNSGKTSEVFDKLKSGFLIESKTENVYIYSESNDLDASKLYNKFKEFSYKNYSYVLPENYMPLETDEKHLYYQLLNIDNRNSIAIIISDNENTYRNFINAQKDNFAFKGILIKNAEKMIDHKGRGIIDNFLLSLYARSGNKPWLLKELNYDDYTFIDVSRGVARYMAYTLIANKEGNMEIKKGNPQKGEALDDYNLNNIFNNFIMNSKKSIIYVRDGSISKSELEIIKNKYIEYFDNFLLIEYKKDVNYRIFNYNKNIIGKPRSGTCIKLDNNNYIIVTTGYKEYNFIPGTPTTKLITIKNLKGNYYDINKILGDIYGMCFLNWVSPNNYFSDPAPIHYMDKLLYDMGNNINRKFIPY